MSDGNTTYAKTLAIHGLRGFGRREELRLAVPSGSAGSGLTILVGPNGGGKSTIVEAVRAISSTTSVGFSVGRRNMEAKSEVSIEVSLEDETRHQLRTIERGSTTERTPSSGFDPPWYTVPGRRLFNPLFGRGEYDVSTYLTNQDPTDTRGGRINEFAARMSYALNRKKGEFNSVLGQIIDPVPDWTIDLNDGGQYYISVKEGTNSHSSEGLGEGIVSLLFVVDALYESVPGQLVAIDEPELSLHPPLQRRLLRVLADYGRTLQVVYATHSPYLVEFDHIINGAEVARIHKRDGSSTISQVSRDTVEQLKGFLSNANNPHVLGTNAREAFFQEDGLVLLEGQEDVVYFSDVLNELVERQKVTRKQADVIQERLFGWGVGGAGNMKFVATLLWELGFERVFGILDANEKDRLGDLRSVCRDYRFDAIPADDIRTKPRQPVRQEVHGLLDGDRKIRAEYLEATSEILDRVGEYLRPL